MTQRYTLWAQALDNESPDHFEVHGEELPPDDATRRQAAVSRVSRVIKRGTRIYDVGGVILTADDTHFVLEVPSVQRDVVGRTAPIVCHGQHEPAVLLDHMSESVVLAVDGFARRIGRTLRSEDLRSARASLSVMAKKKTASKSLAMAARLGALGALALLLLLLALWLAYGRGTR